MLFSNDDVVKAINSGFEPVWESVRPVPIVKIDFGNGHVITRTLNGNIATYACAADGQVLDILPGIYAPAEYQERLNQLRLLASYADVDREGPAKRNERLAQYHRGQLEALAKGASPPRFINFADMGKARIEGAVKAMLVPASHAAANPPTKTAVPAGDLGGWKLLLEDTRHNESIRRKAIHDYLAQRGSQPASMTKWLYREVLHADLDDPHLGLGKVLFDNYPFAREEGRN